MSDPVPEDIEGAVRERLAEFDPDETVVATVVALYPLLTAQTGILHAADIGDAP